MSHTRVKLLAATVALAVLLPAALAASGVLSAISKGPYLSRDDLRVQTPTPLGLEAVEAGIKVVIVSVEYSATSTTVVLELHSPIAQATGRGLFDGFHGGALTIDGLTSPEVRQHMRSGPLHGVERHELVLGAVSDPEQDVLFQIDWLCPIPADASPCPEQTTGPWSFRLPAPGAVDSRAHHLRLDESVTHEGITLTVHDIRFSSSEILVTYSLSSDVRVRAAGPQLELVYDDGTIALGSARPGETSFPPLKAGAKSFTLRSQALVKLPPDVPGRREHEMALDLAAALARRDIHGPVDSVGLAIEREVLGERFTVVEAQIGAGKLRLTVVNTTAAGAGSLLFASGSGVYLIDDDGVRHSATELAIGFSKDLQGKIGLGDLTLGFEGVDPSRLRNARLVSTSVATFVKGPWEFRVTAP